jgi:DNA-binding transcriptional MerR regulator
VSYRIREVAERANVPESFVRRLVAVGALPPEEQRLGPREVRRAQLLYSWAAAGLSVESIVELMDRGALSLMFLDAPVMATPERLDRSYQQLAADRGCRWRSCVPCTRRWGSPRRSRVTGPGRTT